MRLLAPTDGAAGLTRRSSGRSSRCPTRTVCKRAWKTTTMDMRLGGHAIKMMNEALPPHFLLVPRMPLIPRSRPGDQMSQVRLVLPELLILHAGRNPQGLGHQFTQAIWARLTDLVVSMWEVSFLNISYPPQSGHSLRNHHPSGWSLCLKMLDRVLGGPQNAVSLSFYKENQKAQSLKMGITRSFAATIQSQGRPAPAEKAQCKRARRSGGQPRNPAWWIPTCRLQGTHALPWKSANFGHQRHTSQTTCPTALKCSIFGLLNS